jgi:hypothetical protein
VGRAKQGGQDKADLSGQARYSGQGGQSKASQGRWGNAWQDRAVRAWQATRAERSPQMVMLETSEFVMYSLSCYTRSVVSVILSIRNTASSIYAHMFNKCSVIVLLSLAFFNGLEPSIRGSS